MDANLDIQIEEALKAYRASGVEDQVGYQYCEGGLTKPGDGLF